MSVLVEQQDEQINVIETTAAAVEKDTEAGLVTLLICSCLLYLSTSQSPIHRKGRRLSTRSPQEALDMLRYILGPPHHHCHRGRGRDPQGDEEVDVWTQLAPCRIRL